MRDWLKDLRTEHGYTMAQMGEKLDISEGYYSYIENGERKKKMDLSLAQKLANIFCLSIQQIVEFEEG